MVYRGTAVHGDLETDIYEDGDHITLKMRGTCQVFPVTRSDGWKGYVAVVGNLHGHARDTMVEAVESLQDCFERGELLEFEEEA